MAVALTDAQRAAIVADVRAIADGHAPERSAGQIARQHGRARSTITRVAEDAGLAHVWRRDRTAAATAAKTVDNRARRAQLAAGFLDDVDLMRTRLRRPYDFAAGTKDGIDVRTLEEPPASESAAFVRAAKVAFDAHLAAEKHDNDGGTDEGRGAMLAFLDAVRAVPPGQEPQVERPEDDDEGP